MYKNMIIFALLFCLMPILAVKASSNSFNGIVSSSSVSSLNGIVSSSSVSSLNGIVTAANKPPIICVNGNPNINSTVIYLNTNSSKLIIFADSNVPNAGYYGSTLGTIAEAVNISGSNGKRLQSTMYVPSENYLGYTFNSGINIFHCQWVQTATALEVPITSSTPPPNIVFIVAFIIALVFTVMLFLTFQKDWKDDSNRPLYLLLLALAGWFITLPALVSTNIQVTSYNGYNVISQNTIIAQFPSLNVTTYLNQPFPIGTFYTYLTIWSAIMLMLFVILILYLIQRAKRTAEEATKSGKVGPT